ncbi:MAG: HAMP domain-containing histidine kinase [Clostridiales bacterium]|nr:HAMP domain-containing histidine kinase [Candidatus Crickella equi]
MINSKHRKAIITLILVLSFACIGVGVLQVWDSFKSFEKSIIEEKDTQINKRITLEDANIKNTLDNYVREAKVTNGKSIVTNPINAGVVVFDDGKIVREKSDITDCKITSLSNTSKYVICTDSDGQIYMAYKIHKDNLTYYRLISLVNLLNDVIGTEQDSEEMNFLMDCDGKIVVYKVGESIQVAEMGATEDSDINKCIKFFQSCIASSSSKATSITLLNDDKEEYTARIVMQSVDKTDNGLFAIGKTANYDDTIKPSMKAANKIFIYGSLIVLGIAIIVLIFILIQRSAVSEIQTIRTKNETLEEINQRMQALTHHQRLETIGTMTAGIAHDFNNLLTPIMGYSMMTMDMLPRDAEELQENLQEIYNASSKAKDLVSRLAELSRKGDASTYEDINIDELIKNTIRVSRPVKPENVEVVEKLEVPGVQIRGDRTQLSQMILNFTLNAYDALQDNGGTYMVATRHEDGKLIVQFIDNGPGMDAETVSKIFDPFFTTKESGKGTGLGLAIIAQIAETHNAKIYVDSELGKGTEFRVVFNCKE